MTDEKVSYEVPETLKTNVFLVQTGLTLIQAPKLSIILSDNRN